MMQACNTTNYSGECQGQKEKGLLVSMIRPVPF